MDNEVQKPYPITYMLDFSSLDTHIQSTPIGMVILAYLLTLTLSLILVFCYDKSSRNIVPPDNFIQSIILMALVATSLMMSIGDSLARSFGIFGALAIIRFRVRITDPRDIAFIFAAMAVGIACGVNSFIIAIIGTLIFCIVAFLLMISPFSKQENLIGNLRFELPSGEEPIQQVNNIIKKHCNTYAVKAYKIISRENGIKNIEFEYDFQLKKGAEGVDFLNSLEKTENISALRIRFNNTM